MPQLDVQVSIPKPLKNTSQAAVVLLQGGSKYEYVINVDGAFERPKGSTLNSNNPLLVMKAVFSLSFSSIVFLSMQGGKAFLNPWKRPPPSVGVGLLSVGSVTVCGAPPAIFLAWMISGLCSIKVRDHLANLPGLSFYGSQALSLSCIIIPFCTVQNSVPQCLCLTHQILSRRADLGPGTPGWELALAQLSVQHIELKQPAPIFLSMQGGKAFLNPWKRLIQNRRVPSFLGASTTGLDQLLKLGRMTPCWRYLSTSSLMYTCSVSVSFWPQAVIGLASVVSIVCFVRPLTETGSGIIYVVLFPASA
ncbi:hypothetical protein Pelo_8804 [Pelomyxa schiedti]|nr:hypothetical protein Pelo_8804 [Pelomyxa schiedti]